jgi:hypothetical protein
VTADEGMWTFDNFPLKTLLEGLHKVYHLDRITEEIESARKNSSIRDR